MSCLELEENIEYYNCCKDVKKVGKNWETLLCFGCLVCGECSLYFQPVGVTPNLLLQLLPEESAGLGEVFPPRSLVLGC